MRGLYLLFTLFSLNTFAQKLSYPERIIETLTFPEMHGRGYINNGHKLAANFIASEFQALGLQSFSINYQQQFPITVNTFSKVRLAVDGKKLQPAIDYLIDPSSPGIKGNFDLVNIEIDSLLNNTADWVKEIKTTEQAILLNKVGYDTLSTENKKVIDGFIEVLIYDQRIKVPLLIIRSDDKLTWGVSQQLAPRTTIYLKDSQELPASIGKVHVNIKNEQRNEIESQNVIGMIRGKRSDSLIMVTAHYDHLGMLGGSYFPGANDNASGVAMMLDIARFYSFEQKPEFNTLFIAFGGEEAGLIGSKYYTQRPIYPLKKIKFLVNLDMVGTGDDGITVVNGSLYKKEFALLNSINKQTSFLPEIKSRGAACNSDHCSFYEAEVPSFFIYTLGGIQAYHDVNDRFQTLPLTQFAELKQLLIAFIDSL
ncbi:MAG: M28 family peptidase [Cyclobacteriaceae bacterium]